MKKVLNILVQILLMFWQFPQELLGFICAVFFFGYRKIVDISKYKTSYVFYIYKFPGGMSLSRFIFINPLESELAMHEYGHSRQSMFLGPLYLLVIGLPSLVWALLYKSSWKKSYYWFWTEKWANRLGGVVGK